MRLITLNFACCAVKDCKGKAAAFPLRPQDAELSSDETLYDKDFLINVLPKLEWQALKSTTAALGFSELQATPPTVEDIETNETLAKDLHKVLLETEMMEGKLVCGNCGHEYQVKEGICNFLLPAHLV